MQRRPAVFAALLSGALVLQGCAVPTGPASSGVSVGRGTPDQATDSRDFRTIVARVEPVAERTCRAKSGNRNCDFHIVLDTRPDQPPNAFQTLEENGRPLLVVNQTLINELSNADEIAFVISHEAAHHISDHLTRQQASTYAGALAAGLAAAAIGASTSAISAAQEFGAYTGSRAYSKNYELEADSLGAQIAYYAGYDPERGVAYFTRAPDPGNVFLGTHPPNTQRVDTVRKTMAKLR